MKWRKRRTYAATLLWRASSLNYFALVGVGVSGRCAEKVVVGERES